MEELPFGLEAADAVGGAVSGRIQEVVRGDETGKRAAGDGARDVPRPPR
jgi:hypothetical protein